MDLASGDSVRLEDLVLELWPLAEPSIWIAVTDGAAGDASPRWFPDGNLLYYARIGFTLPAVIPMV
jgi:hypothetical protein